MRRISTGAALAAVSAAALLLAGAGLSATRTISITKTGFQPASVAVAAGDTVTWTNSDTAKHQVVADNGSFSSPVLAPGQVYSHVFTSSGTFSYHDGLNPLLKGTVAVSPPGVVSITHNGFEPPTTTIKAGTTVTWTNNDTANHQVVADDGSFSSPVLAPKQSYTHTFPDGGSFGYHDGLQPTVKGTVVVTSTAPPEAVSLQSTTDFVTYGQTLTLTGQVANGMAGETVSISAHPQLAGKVTQSIQTATTAADGSFTVQVQPLVHTVYVASTAKTRSEPLAIGVRPALGVGWIGRHVMRLNVRAATAFTNHYAVIQYWNARAHVWSSISRLFLTSAVTVLSPTVVTTGTARLHVRAHLRLRAMLAFNQARPGYVSGISNTIRS